MPIEFSRIPPGALDELVKAFDAEAEALEQKAKEQFERHPEEVPGHSGIGNRELAKVHRETAQALSSVGLKHQIAQEKVLSPWMKDWPDERVLAHIRETEETRAEILRQRKAAHPDYF